ncbi:MAG: hypothetical protein GF317_24560 [Candidatus Lokiarchaeota archaeon]|nr:hypothetical protein [Candidatus Lokiarchaeota archaeon]
MNYKEIEKINKGFEYSFKNRDSKKSRSENLNKQIELRDSMRDFLADEKNENKSYNVSAEDGELLIKKLEYRFKNNKNNQTLINLLKS